MLKKWKVRQGDKEYAWDGESGTPEVESLVQKWKGRTYRSLDGQVCGPEWNPNMVLKLVCDLLIGNYDEIIEWEFDDEEEPGMEDIPTRALT